MTAPGPRQSHDIPLPTLNIPKGYDFAPEPRPIDSQENIDMEARLKHDSDTDSTVTDSSDEFDWDAEDDAASSRGIETVKAKRGRAIWRAFIKLARPVRTILVGIIGAGICITPLLVFHLRFNSSPARIQAHVWSLWFTISWAAGAITYLVVDLLPSIAMYFVWLVGYKTERMQTPIQLIAAVCGWLKLALSISWMWIALGVIRASYNPPGSYWTVINRVMQALFSAGIILLVEKVFLQYVAINFHRKALADRLEENRRGLEALERLSSASMKNHPYGNGHGRKGHRSRSSSADMLGFAMGAKKRIDRGHVSASSSTQDSPIKENDAHSPGEEKESNIAKRIKQQNAERRQRKRKAVASVIVDNIGGAIGQLALKDSKFNKQAEFGSLQNAGKLAKKLFSTLSDVHPPRQHLVVEDFIQYFKTPQDAQIAFALFDKDGNGDISKREMREAVRRIYRERRDLTTSLKDVGSAVAKLDAVLLCLALVIFVFVCLLIFNQHDTLTSLVPLASIVLGFSFIFGHSGQTLFESLIFIFSTHVYDVGDLVMIDDSPMFVRELGLFSTTFRRVDGCEIIAPNSLLNSAKLVHNMRRSNAMWETTNLMVSYDTPLEIIEQLRLRLQAYIARPDTSREWSNVSVNIDKMEYQNAIFIIIGMEHRPNWQDWGGRWVRRTAFMRHLKTVLEELDIRYTKPVQPLILPKELSSRFGGSNSAALSSGYLASPKLRFPGSPARSPTTSQRSPRVRTSKETMGSSGRRSIDQVIDFDQQHPSSRRPRDAGES